MTKKRDEITNPLFGMMDEVVKAVVRTGQLTPSLGSFWEGKERLTYSDMFCGIGGFHIAADSLGMECVFACDIDEEARRVYEHNFHSVPESAYRFRINRTPGVIEERHVLQLIRFDDSWIEPVEWPPR
ncbi:MAG: DNA cytosine methyltransferase [Acidobacteriota bacterium]